MELDEELIKDAEKEEAENRMVNRITVIVLAIAALMLAAGWYYIRN